MPTILNVDAREPTRCARSRVLKEAGYRVIEAATGQEALRMLATVDLQLAILEVQLPDMTGWEVYRKIKGHPATAHVLVLHVSAAPHDSDDKVFGFDTGSDGYLVEPCWSAQS